MKTTYSVTQAHSKLPGLLKEVNKGAAAYGITVNDDVKAYLVGKERMESILETLEILSNREAVQTLRDYESGQLALHTLDEVGE